MFISGEVQFGFIIVLWLIQIWLTTLVDSGRAEYMLRNIIFMV